MRGQLALGLHTRLTFASVPEKARAMMGRPAEGMTLSALARPLPEGNIYWDWSAPFFSALVDGRIASIDDAAEFAPFYAGTYWAEPEWERAWDRFLSTTRGTRAGIAAYRGDGDG